MIDFKKITRGKRDVSPKVLIYSFPGIGKTRFASGAPDPFFIDTDKGSHFYDVARVVPETWSETIEWLQNIEQGKVKCQSVVIDSITQLEYLGHTEFFAGEAIDSFGGGYGKGDTHALMRWRELVYSLERIHEQGKGIILVAHAIVKKFDDPTGPGYERFQVGARPRLASFLIERVDYAFFCREEVSLTLPPKGTRGNGKAITSGVRWAYTRQCPAYDAKARGNLLFPEKFLLSWDEFMRAVEGEKQRSKEMEESIGVMLKEIDNRDLTKKVTDFMRQHPEMLVESHQKVSARLEVHRASKQAIDSQGAPAQAAQV